MKKSIAAIAVAGMLTIGMVSLPSAAMADETGTSDATTEIGPNMTTCDTDRLCDTLQQVHQTGQQLKTDLDTAKQHAEQLHQNARDDADALRQYSEQAWKNYQEDREDIKTALDGASKRGQEVHDTLHQDAQDTQAHLNQLHNDLQEDHAALKAQHDSLVAARQEWHKSFIQALKDTQNGLFGTGTTSGANSAASNGTAVQTVSGNDSVTTAPSSAAGNGSTAKSSTAASASSANQTSVASGAVTKSEYSQLAQTGIGISVACAIILALSGLAYAVKMFVQYKRETAE